MTCFTFESFQPVWLFLVFFVDLFCFFVFSFFPGGPNIWAITSEERAKHDKQFDKLKPTGGFITGWSEALLYTLTSVYTYLSL